MATQASIRLIFVTLVHVCTAHFHNQREHAPELARRYETEVLEVLGGFSGEVEGPAFDKSGKLFVSDENYPFAGEVSKFEGKIYEVDLLQTPRKFSLVVEPKIKGTAGFPTGLEFDKDGVLWAADARLGLLRVPSGSKKAEQVTTTDSDNNRLQGMHDLMFDLSGNIWLAAPYPEIAPTEWPFDDVFDVDQFKDKGSLYCYIPSSGTMRKLDSGFWFANAVAVQHDGNGTPKVLIVAATFERTLWAYDVTGPCQIDVSSKREWGEVLIGEQLGGPDGMAFDIKGNLLMANNNAGFVDVYGKNGGKPQFRVPIPFQFVTNIAFKPGTREVYLTESEAKIWSFEWKFEGMKLYGQR